MQYVCVSTYFSDSFPIMNSINQISSANPIDKNEDEPKTNYKQLINPIWKIRILAILTICVLVVPVNIATLYIYATTEGNIIFKNV